MNFPLKSSRLTGAVLQDLARVLKIDLSGPVPVDVTRLRELATEHGVSNDQFFESLAQSLGLDWQEDLSGLEADENFVSDFPIALARKQIILGFKQNNGVMPVAIANENGLEQLDIVSRFLKCDTRPFFAPERILLNTINQAYQKRRSQTDRTIEALDTDDSVLKVTKTEREDLLDQTGRPTVIRLVNSILFDAAQDRASDIHIQPFENRLQVRFRIDGVLFDQFEIPKASQEEILSRIKIIGKMNIAEKRLPQDGRATAEIGDRMIDLRISSLPTSHGERIVIRLLDKSAQLYTLNEIGMADDLLEIFERLIRLEHGLILVTGPTGGGKSTTLYASLQQINTNESNVVAIEDPIEYQLDGISQTQVSEKKGMTFAKGLRSVLRQDPDIIMIGEIRDRETAEMAIQSALTGHMVFSTLHTNDAPSAITRLLDLGIEPFLVSSSVVGVLSQRLVRRICQHCKRQLDPAELPNQDPFYRRYKSELPKIFIGRGCSKCRGTGFYGRIGIFEFMIIEDKIRELIQTRMNAAEIRNVSQNSGMRLLHEDGIIKIAQGLTTTSEVARVTMQTD